MHIQHAFIKSTPTSSIVPTLNHILKRTHNHLTHINVTFIYFDFRHNEWIDRSPLASVLLIDDCLRFKLGGGRLTGNDIRFHHHHHRAITIILLHLEPNELICWSIEFGDLRREGRWPRTKRVRSHRLPKNIYLLICTTRTLSRSPWMCYYKMWCWEEEFFLNQICIETERALAIVVN